MFFLRTFTLILKAGKTMSTVTNTSLYIIGSDSLVQQILMIYLYVISRERKSTDLYVRKIPGLWKKRKKEAQQCPLIVMGYMNWLPRWSEAIEVRNAISQVKKCISEPSSCLTYKLAESLVQVCNLVYDRLTPSLITQVLRDIWRGIGQRTHCFASFHLMPIVHQYNGLQPMLLHLSPANKKTLIDISEPAMWHEYWSEGFLVQQLSL